VLKVYNMSKKLHPDGFYINSNPVYEGDGAEVDDEIHPSGQSMADISAGRHPELAKKMDKKNKKPKTKEAVVAEVIQTPTTEVTEAPAITKPAMTLIQKVQLMNSLTEVLSDDALKKSISSKTNGDLVYKILTQAIEKELANMLGNEQDVEITSTLSNQVERMERTIQKIENNTQALASLSAELKNQSVVDIFRLVATKVAGVN